MSLRGRAAAPRVRASWAVLAVLGVASLFGGCASSAPPRPQPPERLESQPLALTDGDQGYLIEPLAGYSGTLDPERRAAIDRGYRGLRQRAEVDAAAAIAAEILASDPSSAPAAVLAAQAEFARGDHAAVVARLVPVGDRFPDYTAAQLVLGRAAERAGDLALAYAAYRVIAARSPLAFERAGALHSRALDTVHRRLEEALERGDVAAARRQLALLEAWGAAETATLEAAAAVARAAGDRSAELAAIRDLSERHPDDGELLERRADLELAIGEPSAAVQIVQALVDRHPQDRRLIDKLDATKFRWRISFLPPDVRELATRPSLNRAELAVLLYWLIPEVRYARPGAGRIAADVLDQPRQEEIIRVVNLGLLDVDPDLHRFSPTSAARRVSAFSAFLRVLGKFKRNTPCLAESLGSVCAEATRCGFLEATDECRPREALSGAEAVEAIRKLVGLLGRFLKSLTIPNLLSLLRMALVPIFIIAVRYGEPKKALLVFLVAGVTDALDGFIARVAKQQSLLGTYLDPIADKLLLTSAWIVLAIPNLANSAPVPVWVTILVIARDLLIVIVALILYLAAGVRRFPPSWLSKITTAVQVITVVSVLVAGLVDSAPAEVARGFDALADVLIYATAVLTLGSGLHYMVLASRMFEAKGDAG